MKKQKVALWEWIVSLIMSALGGVVIWTNESMDLLLKFGINIKPALAFFIFTLFWFGGLSWLLTILLRKRGIQL